MKTFLALAMTLVLTAACLVGCGCTNQNMDNTSAPTVLPTNEEIWNSTETTVQATTETTMATEANDTTSMTDSTEETRGVNETEVQNHVNAQQELNEKIKENQKAGRSSGDTGNNNARSVVPGTR